MTLYYCIINVIQKLGLNYLMKWINLMVVILHVSSLGTGGAACRAEKAASVSC